MANNNNIYNAALLGASGGVASRWLTRTNPALYNNVAAQIVILATAVDALIPANPLLTAQQVELMQNICQQVVSSRWLRVGFNPTNIAASIVALWTRMSTELLNEIPTTTELLNWDGAVDAVLITLPAGHRPGVYLVNGFVNINVLAGGGFGQRRIGFNDEHGVSQILDSPTTFGLSLLTGVVPTDIGAIAIASDGSAPIVMTILQTAISAPFNGDVYSSTLFLGSIT